jgi:hypothetical protein
MNKKDILIATGLIALLVGGWVLITKNAIKNIKEKYGEEA